MGASITLSTETLLNSAALPRMPCDKNHVLIACFPKSGSTWLSEILCQIPGYHRAHLVPAYDRREQELAFERLVVFHSYNYAAQHHCRYSRATERYMQTFSIKPIILIRNIFDCVVSTKEFWDEGVHDNERLLGPMAYVPKDYYSWADSVKFDFIIDMIIPWYFNFFVGWCDYSGGSWVAYENLLARPEATIRTISDELGLGLSESQIQTALESASQKPTLKNVAQVGRGEALTKAHKERVHAFATYYPRQDFSAIGL